jgi:predicted TIM-barrel fold metal-dependent hydrolase
MPGRGQNAPKAHPFIGEPGPTVSWELRPVATQEARTEPVAVTGQSFTPDARHPIPEWTAMDDLMTRYHRGEPPGPLIFDCHAHMGRWIFPVFSDGSPAAMVAEMDRFCVTAVAAAHHACMGPYPSEGNRLAEGAVAEFPGRLYAWCGYSPHYPEEGPAELQRVFSNPRFVGIKLHPATHETAIDDPRYRPAFEFADAHGLPVLIHSWVGGGCRPELIAKVAADFPEARFIIAHHGGAWDGVKETVEACKKCQNVCCDTCASELVYMIVDRLTEGVGVGRVLFGSDIPFLALGPQVGKVIYSRISDEEKAKVLGGNFVSILKARTGLPPVPLP